MASTSNLTPVDRVFVKRTRRGAVKTHVRQSYLRDDLPCASPARRLRQPETALMRRWRVSRRTGSPHLDAQELEPKLQGERYLVLDTNVVLHQIDLLERPALRDVIVLQTVLDEVRHNKISVHKRLRALVDDESRRFHVFCNEFHRDTYTARAPGESPNDRNDRAIRMAASWYKAQLGEAVQVLLLTNDADNLRKAQAEGLAAQRIHTFVGDLPGGEELRELLAAAPETEGDGGGSGGRGRRAQAYPAHLPMSELTRGVQAGELHQGKLRVNRHNSSRGAVGVRSLEGHSEVPRRARMRTGWQRRGRALPISPRAPSRCCCAGAWR
jgi:exosome complex exonuclease DIS3/RRP44